jgi:hypothetical protein
LKFSEMNSVILISTGSSEYSVILLPDSTYAL